MLNRCPESDTVQIHDEDVQLQCVEWSPDPGGRHRGDHHVQLPPVLGGEHTWANENPLPEDEPG